MSEISPVGALPKSELRREVLSAEELRRWRRPVAWRAARDLAGIWLQILLAVGLYLWIPHWSTFALAFVLVAGGQHGLALATHEFMHFLVVPQNHRLNDLIGTFLFAAPSMAPLPLVRRRHFLHHRTYSAPDDPKRMYRRDWQGAGLFREILRGITGYDYLSRLWEVREQDSRAPSEGKEAAEPLLPILGPLAGVQAAILAAFWAVGQPGLYLTLWLLPLFTLSHFFHVVRGTVEHRPLRSESGKVPNSGFYADTADSYVRTNNATLLERLFLCKINFCYHVEHHLWPQIPYQYLPLVRERLLEKGVLDDPCLGFEDTYLSTMYKIWRPPESPREVLAAEEA